MSFQQVVLLGVATKKIKGKLYFKPYNLGGYNKLNSIASNNNKLNPKILKSNKLNLEILKSNKLNSTISKSYKLNSYFTYLGWGLICYFLKLQSLICYFLKFRGLICYF